MSWNNITPIWILCNPFKIPNQPGYYFLPPGTGRKGPYSTYQEACEGLIQMNGKICGKEEWLE